MSMHEFEDLVEESIRILAASDLRDQLDVRSACWWLYDFQNHWDTGFTHFRVMDILLDCHFAYRFALTQHPDYERERAYFDSLKDFAFLHASLTQPAGKSRFDPVIGWTTENPFVGYYNPPYLYCDAGSRLWARFVESGTLIGRDALPPDADMGITGAVLAVARAAEQQKNLRLIGDWYAYLALQLASLDDDPDRFQSDLALADFVALIQHLDVPEGQQRSPEPLMALRGGFTPLIRDVPAYLEQVKEVRRMQANPDA